MKRVAAQAPVCSLLMTRAGVGAMTVLHFKVAIDDPTQLHHHAQWHRPISSANMLWRLIEIARHLGHSCQWHKHQKTHPYCRQLKFTIAIVLGVTVSLKPIRSEMCAAF